MAEARAGKVQSDVCGTPASIGRGGISSGDAFGRGQDARAEAGGRRIQSQHPFPDAIDRKQDRWVAVKKALSN
jgi:hypothetical protein